ncbi:RNA polymerase sigma factor [Achromobacter sp. NPDC058515]|uniref:RNA polymerase sigma factor n=1 Tax=Achromobacter sp. NPDC058515 TaxID=3346533 RepID=UPI00365BDF34
MLNTRHQAPAPISPQTAEAELVSRAALGEEAAFEAIMRRNNRLLFRTARSILKSDTEAEDALQEAYLRAWRALGGFRSDARLSTWLVRIVVNEALGRLRRRDAQVIPLDAAMNAIDPDTQASLTDNPDNRPEHSAMRAQMRALLEARIDLLPEDFRTVFMLRAVEEMSVKEVAQALDIPESTVRTRFFRARSLLREGLASQIDVALADAFSFDGERCDRIVAGVRQRLRPPPPESSRTTRPRGPN